MKKLLSALASVMVAVMPLSVMEVYAEDTVLSEIQVETVSAGTGDEIEVAVNLNNNQGIVAIGFTVDYDTNLLELVDVKDSGLFDGASFTRGGDFSHIPFRLLWENGLATENYTDNGELAILSFRVLDDAESGLAEISINVESGNTFDIDLDEVEFKSISGGVEIAGDYVESTTETTTTSTTEETTTTETTTSTTEETTTTETTTSTTEETTTTETTTSTTEETTTTETTASTTEETTTTETTTSATEEITTTETTIDTTNYFASIEEMCEMASKDYEEKNGTVPAKTEAVTNADGTVSILLKNRGGETLCIYTIDPVTCVGTDDSGKEVNLPQTGNNSLGAVGAVATALTLAVTGAFAVMKSGVICRKKDNE